MSIILFGYYGFDNVGDEQLLDESIKLINELSLSVNYCVANGPYPAPFPTFNRWNPVAWVRQLSQAKTLIFGGGSIFQSSTSFLFVTLLFVGCFFGAIISMPCGFIMPRLGSF